MYKGDLAGFPKEVVEKMLEYQVAQGSKRDVSVFEMDCYVSDYHGGFNWDETPEGHQFWESIIGCGNFETFFKKYPKSSENDCESTIPNTLNVGDTYLNSKGNRQIITKIDRVFGGKTFEVKATLTDVYYKREGSDDIPYCENYSTIIKRFEKGLYTEYKSVNEQKSNINKNENKNEVHRENSESGGAKRKGFRVTRTKVKIASASRPTGSKVTNLRQRSRCRTSKISGGKIQFN